MTEEQKQEAEAKVTQAEVIVVEKPPLLVMAIPAIVCLIVFLKLIRRAFRNK